jgi:hypothetical protein
MSYKTLQKHDICKLKNIVHWNSVIAFTPQNLKLAIESIKVLKLAIRTM